MMRIMWEEKKFRKVSKVKILEFEGNRPVIKNNWTALKKLFRRENSNPKVADFLKKKIKKLKILTKNSGKLVYLNFYFLIKAAI